MGIRMNCLCEVFDAERFHPLKIASELNPADGLTKLLSGNNLLLHLHLLLYLHLLLHLHLLKMGPHAVGPEFVQKGKKKGQPSPIRAGYAANMGSLAKDRDLHRY